MNAKNVNKSYEGLYAELYERAESLHQSNKARIRRGLIGLVILPVVLLIIRTLTDSDKVVFLIIWIICMFILCAYLMMIEYLDSYIQETLSEVSDQEAEFDDLLLRPEVIQGRLRERVAEIRELRTAREAASSGEKQNDPEEGGAE